MARLRQNDLAAIRWYLGQALLLIALSGSYFLDLGADSIITAGILMVVSAAVFPGLVERIPGILWKLSPAVLLVFIVTDFLLAGGDVLPPLFRMILILALFRGMQIRTPREDLQLLLLSLFLLIVTGVLSQEITFGIQMLAYAPVAMGLLFAVNLSTKESPSKTPEPKEAVFGQFRIRTLIARTRERLDYRTLVSGVMLFLMMTAMALLLFILMPRFDIGAALPFPRLKSSTSLSGFSDQVEYGDVVEILEDDTIAMRVDVQADNPPARPYWRMVALDAYYDGGFMVSPRVAREHRRIQHHRFDFMHPRSAGLDDSIWTIYLEGGVSSYIPAGDKFRRFQFNNRITLQLHDLTRVQQATEINASTLSIRFSGMQFDGVIPLGPDDGGLRGLEPVFVDTSDPAYLKEVSFPQTLLAVPDGNPNRRVLSDALRRAGIRKGMPVADVADRISAYLQQGRGYSLESRIPSGEADRVLRWVVSGQAGHCELYAGAFVLIARAAGIPARMVTGFVGGDWNGYENYYMVRNRNAHAWCEILDPRIGWVRVDPTPGYGADSGSVDEALAGGRLAMDRTFTAYIDSLRILWFRRVIQFDSSDQQEMAELVKGAGSLGFDWIRDRIAAFRNRLSEDLEGLTYRGDWSGLMRDGSRLLIGCAVIITTIILFRRWRRRKGFEQHMRRRAGQILEGWRKRGIVANTSSLEAVQLIRYGPVESWPEQPQRTLRHAGKRGSRSAS